MRAITERAPEPRAVEVVHLHTEGEAPYLWPEYREALACAAQKFLYSALERHPPAGEKADLLARLSPST